MFVATNQGFKAPFYKQHDRVEFALPKPGAYQHPYAQTSIVIEYGLTGESGGSGSQRPRDEPHLVIIDCARKGVIGAKLIESEVARVYGGRTGDIGAFVQFVKRDSIAWEVQVFCKNVDTYVVKVGIH